MASQRTDPRRYTPLRRRLRAQFAAMNAACHLCGRAIDYELPYEHPGAFQLDHITPLALGGSNRPENLAPSHRACNRTKSDKTLAPIIRVSSTLL